MAGLMSLPINQRRDVMLQISQYESERWRQLSDELFGQANRLRAVVGSTRAEWKAIEEIDAAARSLFSAFGWIAREYSGVPQ
jgi:hypothetical protein